jgi:hypothetical protein
MDNAHVNPGDLVRVMTELNHIKKDSYYRVTKVLEHP